MRESTWSPPRQLHCASFSGADPGLMIVGSASHASQETAEFVGEFRAPQFMAMGSSLKLLMVAEGTAHIYPRLAPTCEWDTAAGQCVLEQAGGQLFAPNGEVFTYNRRETLLNGDFIALDGDLHNGIHMRRPAAQVGPRSRLLQTEKGRQSSLRRR